MIDSAIGFVMVIPCNIAKGADIQEKRVLLHLVLVITSYIIGMEAFAPLTWSAYTCNAPGTSLTLFFDVCIATFSAIWHINSPTPIGQAPEFLFAGIKRFAVKASKLVFQSLHDVYMLFLFRLLIKRENDFQRLSEDIAKEFVNWYVVLISALNSDGP